MRNMEMDFREFIIDRLKDAFFVTRQTDLPQEVKHEVPDLPAKITFLTKHMYRALIDSIDLIIRQVDRLFNTYNNSHPHIKLCIIIGKWTQDYIEGFFGITRGSKGQHDAVNFRDLFSTLKFMQHSGNLVHYNIMIC